MQRSINSREFNQDVSGAKRLAKDGPVLITDRGEPAYVLMTHAEFLRLSGNAASIVDLLADPAGEHIEFEPRRLPGHKLRKLAKD